MIYPSISLLKEIRSTLTVKKRNCPAIYGHYYDAYVSKQKINWLEVCTMKLKHDIYTHCMSGETVGFSSKEKYDGTQRQFVITISREES